MGSQVKSQKGFSLLEVVVAVAILATLAVFVAQTIQRALQTRSKIQKDIDRTVALREALNLMSRDIQLAFHYKDINVELYNATLAERCNKKTPPAKATDPNNSPPPPPPPTAADPAQAAKCQPKKEDIYTQFIGEAEKLNFASLSQVRRQKDDPLSNQAEIGFTLKACRSRKGAETDSSKCLWRRISPVIDSKPEEGGVQNVVIDHVKSLNFRYLGPGFEEEWLKTWRSDNAPTNDERMRGSFPYAVEITLEIFDTSVTPAKEIGMTIVAPIRFMNNNEEKKETSPGEGAADAS